jgi:hypothetical protein
MSDQVSSTNDLKDRPRAMSDPSVRAERKGMLYLRHIAPLTNYAEELRKGEVGEVPDFDPLDGGVTAKLLFLFEKPGPKTSPKRGGSGFISRDNDDPTAEATFRFMAQAGIRRDLAVIWNVVPWWNETRKVTSRELREGIRCVRELITILPSLEGVVMVGNNAAEAGNYLAETRLPLFQSFHPSPIVKASARPKWDSIPSQWAEAMAALKGM